MLLVSLRLFVVQVVAAVLGYIVYHLLGALQRGGQGPSPPVYQVYWTRNFSLVSEVLEKDL